MSTITQKIKQGQTLISDGAWGTFLQIKGLQSGECPELWNINKPNDVLDIAKSYIDAGADMIETNSFGGNCYKLANYGLAEKVFDINKAAAEISRKAAGPDKHVMGSVGPTGKLLISGDVTTDDLYNAFKEQCIALEAGGVDTIVIETMSDIDEARIAVLAARENTKCEVICTMTFEKAGENEYYTMMGVSPAQMTSELIKAGASIIGANCGNGIKDMVGITKEIRSVDQNIPVLIHANAGLPVYSNGKTIFPESPVEMCQHVRSLANAGANIIGGCCGTTPDHIRQIAGAIRAK